MSRYKFSNIVINSTKKKKPVESDKYTYIGLEHLDSQCLRVNRYGTEVAPIGEKLLMQKGDVLFGKRRAYQKKVAIAPFDGIFSAHGMVLRPNKKVIDERYFPFFISSDYFLNEAIKISVGSLSPTINWKDLKDLEFELPSMQEQKKLAEILWAAEDLQQKYENAASNLEKVQISLFKDFVLDVLDSKDFVKEKLKDITKTTKKSSFAASLGAEMGTYPFFLSGLGEKRIEEWISDGEVILCNDGGAAMFRFVVEKCSYSDHVFGIQAKSKKVKLEYLYYYLKYKISYINEFLFKGTGLKNIDKKKFFKMKILVPSLEKQEKIIIKNKNIEKTYIELNKNIKKTKSIQSSLLNGGAD